MDTLGDRLTEEYDSAKTCPYLGIRGDPETRYAFSSRGHVCIGANPPEGIKPEYQEAYCLKPEHLSCVIYQKKVKGALPLEITANRKSPPKHKPGYAYWGLVILGLIVVYGVITVWDGMALAGKITPIALDALPTLSIGGQDDEAAISFDATEDTASSLETTPIPPTRTALQSTSTATIHPTWTVQPTLTSTPPPTPGPGLGTPFGADQIYVIYRVQEGQSLQSLAELYNTSPDAIQAANILRAGRTVWPRDIIVIPVDQDDAGQVTQFTYRFIEKKTNIQELATEYNVTIEDLREYNVLGADEWIPAGRWLIIPVVGE